MKILLSIPVWVAALAFASAAGCDARAAEPVKLWELSGLERPESALPDPARGIVYVSSMAGEPTVKDGNGFISTISLDGKLVSRRWATGLDAPKGMALVKDRLYVADIDKVVEIDAGTGAVVSRHDAAGAKFLNDVAADEAGRVYVSDMASNVIWRLADGKLERWIEDAALDAPNGLTAMGGDLIVASFGALGADGKTRAPSHLRAVSLDGKSVRDLGDGRPAGNLDGLEPLAGGAFLVSDWVGGALYRIEASGEAVRLLDLNQGSADIGYLADKRTVFVPQMLDGAVAAYRIE